MCTLHTAPPSIEYIRAKCLITYGKLSPYSAEIGGLKGKISRFSRNMRDRGKTSHYLMLAVQEMITTDFEKLSFHDSSIEKINRIGSSTIIEFKGAFLGKEHPESEGRDWWIDEGKLTLLNVEGEEAKFWYDNKEGKPHPKPEFPIDEIMNLDIEGDYFKFEGFLEREPWVEWYVKSSQFKVEIDTTHEIHS